MLVYTYVGALGICMVPLRGWKRASDLLEVELVTAGSCYVGVEN